MMIISLYYLLLSVTAKPNYNISALTRPIVSALHTDRPSQWRKKPEQAVSSRTLRRPMRAQNRTVTDWKMTAVGMRGCRRRSSTPAATVAENPKTFSA
jgi:hypothetical protein